MASAPLLDRFASFVSPKWGMQRAAYRAAAERAAQFSYRGGVPTRTDRDWADSRASNWKREPDQTLDKVRDRSRSLEKNDCIASGLLGRCVENVVGTGILPQAMSADESWNDQAEELFTDWMMTQADVRRLGTFFDMQAHLFRAYMRDGDAGAVLLDSGSLQLIDGDSIATPPGMESDKTIIDGVKCDALGRPVTFYIAASGETEAEKFKPVSADDFIFYPRRKHFNDTRGWPALAEGIGLYDQIEGYIEGTVAAAQMAAMFGLAFKTAGSQFGTLGQVKDSQGTYRPEQVMEPGMMLHLQPGEEVVQIQPHHPGQMFDTFLASMVRILGLPFGIPLEIAFLDFSRTNYSSARASLLQAYLTFTCLQRSFINTFLARVWRWRISKFIKAGELPERPDAWKHKWIAPGWPWVDPEKEMKAYKLAIDENLTTREAVVASQGGDWRQVAKQRAIEKQEDRRLGIEPPDDKVQAPADRPAAKGEPTE